MGRVLPILFNTDMVRAIMVGRKKVTRRVVKKANLDAVLNSLARKENPDVPDKNFINLLVNAPCGKGDILYVRETWAQIIDIPHWGRFYRSNMHPITPDEYIYKADNVCVNGILPEIKWHPSIHMPKEAARIWLKVTDVRVERLQDMRPTDCLGEGIRFCGCPAGFTWKPDTDMKNCYIDAIGAMKALWDSTVKKADMDQYGWDADPWVWVIEFERCEKPEREG